MHNKIKELKIKLKRTVICKELSNVLTYLDVESFISIEDTRLILKKVYEKVGTLTNQKEIDNNIESNLKEIAKLKDEYRSFFNNNAILFYYEDEESGAIKIKVEDFFRYLYDIAEFTRFRDGYTDLIFVDENLKFGICIERYEYFNKLIVWN